jgi:hypothetical protein
MSLAATAGLVGGPTYLSGSTLGTVAAVALGVATSLVDVDADEQAARSDAVAHEKTNEERVTITPW